MSSTVVFRSGSRNSTPKRRMTMFPFCTTPGQDLTMDNSYNMEPRSPSINGNGSSSPRYGRSVREFEEQMASLKKENFNLKLRIYFLEEKLPPGGNGAQEGFGNLVKENVDLKIDIELLRKELAEKQTLLCDAAKALGLMECQQKDIEAKHEGTINELNEKIRFLELEVKELEKKSGDLAGSENGGSEVNISIQHKIQELEELVKEYKQKAEELKTQNDELGSVVSSRDEKIKELGEKIKQVLYDNAVLEEQLAEQVPNAVQVEKSIDDQNKLLLKKNEELDSYISENKSLKEIIIRLNDELKREKLSSDEKVKIIKEQRTAMDEMQYSKLKEELTDHKMQLADKICLLEEAETKLKEKTSSHEKSFKVIQELLLKTKVLQGEIETLKKSNSTQCVCRKVGEDGNGSNTSTAPCEITNSHDNDAKIKMLETTITKITEQKDVELKTLDNKLTKIIEQKDAEIDKLNANIKKRTADLQNFVNKVLWEKNREIERLTKVLGQSSSLPPVSPVKEVDRVTNFTETEFNHALERNKYLQKKVDNLVQQIKALTERGLENAVVHKLKLELQEANEDAEKAHTERRQYAEICGVLTRRLEELAKFLDSLLGRKDVLNAIAADKRREIRTAIDKSLDLSRSLNNMSLSFNGSFNEQSLANLSNLSALLDHTHDNKENKTMNVGEALNLSQVESLKAEVKALKKELDKRKTVDSLKKERRSLPLTADNHSESEAWSEPDRQVSKTRIGLEEPLPTKPAKKTKDDSEKTTTESSVSVDRKMKSTKSDKTIQIESKLAERDNEILKVKCELVEADNRYQEKKLKCIEMERELGEYKKVNEMLEIEIANFKSQAGHHSHMKKQLEEKSSIVDKLNKERDQLIMQANTTQRQIDTLRQEVSNITEKHERHIRVILQEESDKRTQLEADMLAKFNQKLEELQEGHNEILARDYVSRYILEENDRKLKEAQLTIELLKENEQDMSNELSAQEKSIKDMKKSVDESTLQASKAVLERTKAVNENMLLEEKIKELTLRLDKVENEKLDLLRRIDRSRVLYEQPMRTRKGRSLSSNGSDYSHSGYTSEEVPVGRGGAGAPRFNNSSPDLGIESDTGRVSSVEIATAQAELLRTIEISSSGLEIVRDINQEITHLSNKMNEDEGVASNTGNSSSHDCGKIEHEHAELKKKYNRTRRALEETWNKLRAANQRKEQIERDIRQQIMKTQNVLKNVRTNMENEMVEQQRQN